MEYGLFAKVEAIGNDKGKCLLYRLNHYQMNKALAGMSIYLI
jgi:hypothetical protein